MNFNILLGLSAVVCLVGLFIRLSIWFSQGIHPDAVPAAPAAARIGTALKAMLATLFSAKVFLIIKSLVVDLLFQKRIFDKSSLRWLAHTLIFFGFILLLLIHAANSPLVVHSPFIKNYQSTLSPYLLLRNLFGLMVLAGVAIAIFRRITLKTSAFEDLYRRLDGPGISYMSSFFPACSWKVPRCRLARSFKECLTRYHSPTKKK